jgi:hypothetical protein
MIAEKIEAINTDPAATSFMIFIFGLNWVSCSLHNLSMDVFNPSNDKTIMEQINMASHSIFEIFNIKERINTNMKTMN